jgi:HTH-type transcriptional regulator / antitoxin HigA
MSSLRPATPEVSAILRAWLPFKQLIGVTSVRTKADYRQARATLEVLLNEVGDDENHPLAEVLDYLADKLRAYEDERSPIPAAPPQDVLRLLMEQHGLKQSDMADCAPQGRISDVLSGRRAISKALAQRLAQRFGVRADLFL